MFFWNSLPFSMNPMDVDNLISGSSALSKSSLNIWKFTVHVLLKPGLENFEYYFTSMWDECNCVVVWALFCIAFLWDWNENWPFPVLWPLLSFPNLLAYWMQQLISQYSWESSQKPCTHVIEKHKTQGHSPRAVCHLNFPSVALPWSRWSVTAPGLYLLWLHAPHTSTLFSVQLNQHHPGGSQHQAGEGAAGSSAFFHVERCVLKDTIETGGEKNSFSPLSAIKLHHTPRVLYLCRMSQCVRGLYLVTCVSMAPAVGHYLHYYDFIC